MANSVDPDQTAPIGAVCSGSMLFAPILNLSVMLGNYLQQTTFSDTFFFLGALRVNFHFINILVCTILKNRWHDIGNTVVLCPKKSCLLPG